MQQDQEAYSCPACGKKYPIVLGIPDFRVFSDPYIDVENDYKKARFLVNYGRNLDFQALVRFYWSVTPEVSPERAGQFMKHTFGLVEVGAEHLREIDRLSARRRRIGNGALLEIGCGTGGFLIAAKERFASVVGIDIAFRWLVIARKRIEEAGLDIPLICACAEHLPLKDKCFDLIVAQAVLEHVRDQSATLSESHRVLRPHGAIFITTPNRFSILPEPHVHVWGVGFLPRKFMDGYVKLIKGIRYQHLKPLSIFEWKTLLNKSSFHDHQVILPDIPASERKALTTLKKIQIALYDVMRKAPLVSSFLYLIGPLFHILCYSHGEDAESRMQNG
jgi:2-polyprenyl-3-methyl-5-hydroxy-6-metoxy-1,4-benzoquinol methylase